MGLMNVAPIGPQPKEVKPAPQRHTRESVQLPTCVPADAVSMLGEAVCAQLASTDRKTWFSGIGAAVKKTCGSAEGLAVAIDVSEPGWHAGDADKKQFASCSDEVTAKWIELCDKEGLTIKTAEQMHEEARAQFEVVDEQAADVFAAIEAEAAPTKIMLERFSDSDLLSPIEPERYVMPGLPVDAYGLLAGGLSAYKSRLTTGMTLTKATGRDILRMYDGAHIASGPVWVLSYEDTGKRVRSRFQQFVQHYHVGILAEHGADVASQFIADINRNVVRSTFVGQTDARFTVTRDRGLVRNAAFIKALVEQARAIKDERGDDLLVILDPLRLAVAGEMNEGEAAAVAANTFNHVASEIGNCCLLVVSHTTKLGGTEGVGGGYADASYATSGSAVLSQHARSNFHMARLATSTSTSRASVFPISWVRPRRSARRSEWSCVRRRPSTRPSRLPSSSASIRNRKLS